MRKGFPEPSCVPHLSSIARPTRIASDSRKSKVHEYFGRLIRVLDDGRVMSRNCFSYTAPCGLWNRSHIGTLTVPGGTSVNEVNGLLGLAFRLRIDSDDFVDGGVPFRVGPAGFTRMRECPGHKAAKGDDQDSCPDTVRSVQVPLLLDSEHI